MPKAKGKHQEKRLTPAEVRSFSHPGRYLDGGGLFLKVEANGAKRWGQRLMIRGKRCDLGLGGFPDVSLAEARKLAEANRKLAHDGGDPLAAKLAAARVPTFREAMEAYLSKKSAEFSSEKHQKQWRATLDAYALPKIGALRVSEITMSDVLRVLEPIWTSKTETASRLRGRIEGILSWATVAGHRSGDNPARWRGNLEEMLSKPSKITIKENHPALALADVPRWWCDLGRREGMSARALAFLTLTGARSGEVRGATWGEIVLEAQMWTVPAARMKAGREHRVPLTDEAVALLKNLPRMGGTDLVFPAPRGGMLSDMSISAVMRRMQESELERLEAQDKAEGQEPGTGPHGYIDPRNKRPAVPHGMRSVFRQWAAEKGFDRDMAELALAHQVGSEVERAYQRSDMVERRRAMMVAWGRFVLGKEVGNVVDLSDRLAG